MSKVAVWLTNYNNERHIAKAIESVLGQTHTDFVLFVFDNHSTDEAPAVIAQYIAQDARISVVPMPEGLAGIPAMKFAWDYLSKLDFDYSITLGGHDYWPNANHLERLVARLDAERAVGNKPALIYSHTSQVDEDGAFCGQYANFLQSAGNMPLALVPQWIISGIDCTPLFGLWNEEVRRQVPVRHTCAGWDHMVVAHAAIKGSILFDAGAMLVMRAPLPGMNMELYGKRHFSSAAQQSKDRDFRNQLEWLCTMIDEAVEAVEPGARDFQRAMLTTSMFSGYICLRGYNLSAFPGAAQAFNSNPDVQRALQACFAAAESVRRLTTWPLRASPAAPARL